MSKLGLDSSDLGFPQTEHLRTLMNTEVSFQVTADFFLPWGRQSYCSTVKKQYLLAMLEP